MAEIVKLTNQLSLLTPGGHVSKAYYYNNWDSVKRGFIPNFRFIASILTEISAEIIKLTHYKIHPRNTSEMFK